MIIADGSISVLRQRPPPITSDYYQRLSFSVGVAQVQNFIAFLRHCTFLALPILAFLTGANAQEIRLGMVGPLSGPFKLLGEQFANGTRFAALDGTFLLIEADDACTADGGKQAAEAMVEAKVAMVTGFLCTPALEAAMPILAKAGIPVLTTVRTESVTDQAKRTGWPIWRIAPRADEEVAAIAEILLKQWRFEHFAILDDGTIYSRELAESFRARAELAGLKPVLVDTFRPQLDNQIGLAGRLKRSGATHVFVGGDRSDIAIIARDADKIDYRIVLAGGEALRAAEEAVPLPQGVYMIALPRWETLAAPEIIASFQQESIVPEGYTVLGLAAADVAIGAIRAAAQENTAISWQLANFTFDTAIGLIRFNEKGDLASSPYRLFLYDGSDFNEVAQ